MHFKLDTFENSTHRNIPLRVPSDLHLITVMIRFSSGMSVKSAVASAKEFVSQFGVCSLNHSKNCHIFEYWFRAA